MLLTGDYNPITGEVDKDLVMLAKEVTRMKGYVESRMKRINEMFQWAHMEVIPREIIDYLEYITYKKMLWYCHKNNISNQLLSRLTKEILGDNHCTYLPDNASSRWGFDGFYFYIKSIHNVTQKEKVNFRSQPANLLKDIIKVGGEFFNKTIISTAIQSIQENIRNSNQTQVTILSKVQHDQKFLQMIPSICPILIHDMINKSDPIGIVGDYIQNYNQKVKEIKIQQKTKKINEIEALESKLKCQQELHSQLNFQKSVVNMKDRRKRKPNTKVNRLTEEADHDQKGEALQRQTVGVAHYYYNKKVSANGDQIMQNKLKLLDNYRIIQMASENDSQKLFKIRKKIESMQSSVSGIKTISYKKSHYKVVSREGRSHLVIDNDKVLCGDLSNIQEIKLSQAIANYIMYGRLNHNLFNCSRGLVKQVTLHLKNELL
jgi:hypothetical protein